MKVTIDVEQFCECRTPTARWGFDAEGLFFTCSQCGTWLNVPRARCSATVRVALRRHVAAEPIGAPNRILAAMMKAEGR